jgi:hypothetical protein
VAATADGYRENESLGAGQAVGSRNGEEVKPKEVITQGGITVLSGTHVIPHYYPVIDWHIRLAIDDM